MLIIHTGVRVFPSNFITYCNTEVNKVSHVNSLMIHFNKELGKSYSIFDMSGSFMFELSDMY